MKDRIVILGGGTFSHIRSHLALSAPAFGTTAHHIAARLHDNPNNRYQVDLVLTKMADAESNLVTNDDVAAYVYKLIEDPTVKGIIFSVALVDFSGAIGLVNSGKYAKRLSSSESHTLELTPQDKIIGRIRQQRKDIFVVGFKTTVDATPEYQYEAGLKLLKTNSLNLVLANDLLSRNNMIIVPEEARHGETHGRELVLETLIKMMLSRMEGHFTRSSVESGPLVPWNSEEVPENLRLVVNHCIEQGAYVPFLGKTAGHFAVKTKPGEILTSIRKTNFNQLDSVGLVRVEYDGPDKVIAHGAKPSVGGQSQRIVFEEHPEMDCIVHFHSELRQDSRIGPAFPVRQQWMHECGSHECGKNTSDGLEEFDIDGHKIKAVYLEEHGPNIVFNRNTPANVVIGFINEHFNLSQKTGGNIMYHRHQ